MRAILIGIFYKSINNDLDYSLHELKALCDTLGYEVVYNVRQSLVKMNSATYFNKGKVLELKELIKEYKADIVIADDALTPLQNKNLELLLETKVIDRTYLILEIFNLRAKTKEAKLEIALAKYRYLLNRTSQAEDTSHESGSTGMAKSRGKGETNKELSRRQLEANIVNLQTIINSLKKKKEDNATKRKKKGVKIVSLVGYTNAGKSSTMNSILELYGDSDKKVLEKDELFATLDTYSRKIKYKNLDFILTDTVGFVSKLPTTLVTSFYDTLAEVKYSDLILYVIDISSPYAYIEFEITYQVLKDIGANNIPFILVFTKVDKLTNTSTYLPLQIINYLAKANNKNNYKEYYTTFINNKNKSGIKDLLDNIFKELSLNYIHLHLNIPYEEGKIINLIEEKANIITKTFYDKYITYDLYMDELYYKDVACFEEDSLII